VTAPVAHDVRPHKIADETFLITWGLDAPPVGHFPMHSLLIRGAQPIIVDTGAPACRTQWLKILMPLARRSRAGETGGASPADVVVPWCG
jgi:hypothetical protein